MTAHGPRRARRLLLGASAALTSMLVLSACQIGLGEDDARQASANATAGVVQDPDTGSLAATLTPAPLAPKGTARIDGSTRGSLTAQAVDAYNQSGSSAEISIGNSGAQSGFDRLCNGSIDMVDSARSISARELEVCRQHGLQVVQFQFAADAVVLAIKSETDVGGDCLRIGQINDIYRAGSAVTNWRDVGFDNVPIRIGGPDRDNNAFDFFGTNVLDAPEPSMTYLRSDYRAYEDDAATRRFVVGTETAAERAVLASYYEQLLTSRKALLTQAQAELATARATAAAAAAEQRKGVVDNRPPGVQEQDQARLDAARSVVRVAESRVLQRRAEVAGVTFPATESARAKQSLDALRGRLAYFRFTYYELFEDQLRPFEISPDGDALNCVFPSEATITSGAYPLSRRLLVTTTTRSLARTEVEEFLTQYLTSVREDAVAARLVPIPEAVVTQQLAWLRGTEPARVVTPSDLSSEPEELERAE